MFGPWFSVQMEREFLMIVADVWAIRVVMTQRIFFVVVFWVVFATTGYGQEKSLERKLYEAEQEIRDIRSALAAPASAEWAKDTIINELRLFYIEIYDDCRGHINTWNSHHENKVQLPPVHPAVATPNPSWTRETTIEQLKAAIAELFPLNNKVLDALNKEYHSKP